MVGITKEEREKRKDFVEKLVAEGLTFVEIRKRFNEEFKTHYY